MNEASSARVNASKNASKQDTNSQLHTHGWFCLPYTHKTTETAKSTNALLSKLSADISTLQDSNGTVVIESSPEDGQTNNAKPPTVASILNSSITQINSATSYSILKTSLSQNNLRNWVFVKKFILKKPETSDNWKSNFMFRACAKYHLYICNEMVFENYHLLQVFKELFEGSRTMKTEIFGEIF